MNLIHLLIFVINTCSGTSYLCTGCFKPYNYGSNRKIGMCPTGFTLNNLTCNFPDSIYVLFDILFNETTSFTNSNVSVFNTALGTFKTQGNPFPTKERGFYFPKNSFLVSSTNFVPSSDQCYDFYMRALESGTVLTVDGLNEFLEIKFGESILVSYRYCGINLLCEFKKGFLEYINSGTENVWTYFSFNLFEGFEYVWSSIYIDMVEVSRIIYVGENAIGVLDSSENFVWKLGNQNSGFKGFIYRLLVTNVWNPYSASFSYVNYCDDYYFLENNECYFTNCSNLDPIWSVRSSCSTCYTNECSDCEGYKKDDCISENVICEEGCSKCSFSTCEICEASYIKIKDEINTYCKRLNFIYKRAFNHYDDCNLLIDGLFK